MGKLQEFYIVFDHPYAVYQAGEVLRGNVIVDLAEPMRMTNIRLWFFGRSKVHWSKKSHSSHRKQLTHYHGEEIYFDQSQLLFGRADGSEVLHPEGVHSYPFTLPLAESLPSSFEGKYGYVRYLCKATIEKPWKFDHDTKTAFTVLSQLDLNYEPSELRTPMQGEGSTELSCCCCVTGNVSATFRINKRGFVPGERIIVSAHVHNGSNTTVSQTKVALKQYVEFSGSVENHAGSSPQKLKCESEFVTSLERGQIAAGVTEIWDDVSLEVPAIPPSRLVGCDIINISYVVKFYVYVSYGEDLKLTCDVIIGTVPLNDVTSPSTSPCHVVISEQPAARRPTTIAVQNTLPPSYEEYIGGRVHIAEDYDTEYTRGQMQWAPSYPMFRRHASMEALVDTCPPV
ncbi:hypothetical protein NP493_239g11065 [Ridgeia piscesae]|uniref:Arrestin C-terminal-like domain-containing protein n=1 Tax=Ridgeia piscesae TaxID=27915 RepID=A0AAD9UDF4_RIDPI|nr:hypothetical protein NP493_239g11065 [Ridgeia piscesae]